MVLWKNSGKMESKIAQVHYRNDRYSIFGGRKVDLKTMDKLEENYLVIPIHHKVTIKQAEKICELINEGW